MATYFRISESFIEKNNPYLKWKGLFCKRAKYVILFLFLILFTNLAYTQQSSTFFLMHDIPQANFLNPAVQINCKYFVAIPVIGSTHLNLSNSTFSFNELFNTDLGSASLDLGGIYNDVLKTNLVNSEINLDLLSLGYRKNEYYFNFNIIEKINTSTTYPRSIVELSWEGNAAFLGEKIEFDDLRTHTLHYREYSIGVSKVWDENNIFGLKAKMLFGKANLYSGKSNVSFYTDPNTFNLHVEADVIENISFPVTITQDNNGNINGYELGEIDPINFLMNSKNKGFAFDLGWIHKYSEDITLSASLLDLGFIRWKTDVSNIHISGTADYIGIGLGTNYTNTGSMSEMVDSILNSFDQDVTNDNYYSWLPTQIYLGGMYQYKPKLAIGLVNRNVIHKSKLHSSITLLANTTILNNFKASLSWSYLNNTLNNIGLGIAWHGKGLQFHLVSDNLLGIVKPMDTRSANLRFGFGVLFGCPKNKKEKLKMSNDFEPMLDGNCYWANKMDKNYKKIKKKKEKRKR